MNSLLLVDPQLGPDGIGMLADHVPGAVADPASRVHSVLALAQAADALDRIHVAADPVPQVLAARAAGCNVAARLLVTQEVERVLLVDPISAFTRDVGLRDADRADSRLAERLAAGPEEEADPRDVAVWLDPQIDEGIFPDAAYELMARGLSRRPDVRERLERALRATEIPRQPYDDRRWRPDREVEEQLDWLANAREASAGKVTIWLSRDASGRLPAARRDYLVNALPNAAVVVQPWEEYEFMVDPEPFATALREWLAS